MNSNPFPAAFLNFKGELQVWPVSLPSNINQCFVEWRMNLLTEQHAVDHMTQSMKDIMNMSLSSKCPLLSAGWHILQLYGDGSLKSSPYQSMTIVAPVSMKYVAASIGKCTSLEQQLLLTALRLSISMQACLFALQT